MARSVGFGVESTYGTAVVPTVFAEALSENLGKDLQTEDIVTIRSAAVLDLNMLTQKVAGTAVTAGEFNNATGRLLKYFIGTVASPVDNGDGTYTHVFPSGALATRSSTNFALTCQVNRDGMGFDYAGIKIVGHEFSASTSQSPRLSWDFIGKSEAYNASPTTSSYDTFAPMLTGDTEVSFDGGSTAYAVEDVTLRMSWPVDEPVVLGASTFGLEPADSAPLAIEGEATLILTSANRASTYAYLDAATTVHIRITVDNGSNNSIYYDMENCNFVAGNAGLSGRDRLRCNLQWRALYKSSAQTSLAVALRNAKATI